MQTLREIYCSHKDKAPKKKVADKTDWQLHLESKAKKPSKMRNKWVTIDGIKFQSTGEGNYYLELKDRLLRGHIKSFKRQISFEFIVNGIKICKYVCDYGVEHFDGSIDILDYKSNFTRGLALYRLKKALMIACYGILIKEVGCK